ncbi:hypothetical protein P7K49_036725, partial [Saguinus oedipus]
PSMETAEKECGALGGLFQAIVNDMKVTGPSAGRMVVSFRARCGRAPHCVSLSERVLPASAGCPVSPDARLGVWVLVRRGVHTVSAVAPWAPCVPDPQTMNGVWPFNGPGSPGPPPPSTTMFPRGPEPRQCCHR